MRLRSGTFIDEGSDEAENITHPSASSLSQSSLHDGGNSSAEAVIGSQITRQSSSTESSASQALSPSQVAYYQRHDLAHLDTMQSTEVINYPRPGLVVSSEEDNPDTSQATNDRDSNSAEEESYSSDGEAHQLHGINERVNTGEMPNGTSPRNPLDRFTGEDGYNMPFSGTPRTRKNPSRKRKRSVDTLNDVDHVLKYRKMDGDGEDGQGEGGQGSGAGAGQVT